MDGRLEKTEWYWVTSDKSKQNKRATQTLDISFKGLIQTSDKGHLSLPHTLCLERDFLKWYQTPFFKRTGDCTNFLTWMQAHPCFISFPNYNCVGDWKCMTAKVKWITWWLRTDVCMPNNQLIWGTVGLKCTSFPAG